MVAEPVDFAGIEKDTAVSESAAIAEYLQEVLGRKIVAYACGLRDPRMVGQWASHKSEPRSPADVRLRQLYQAVRLISDAYGAEAAKAWLFVPNSRLNFRAPAYALRYAKTFDDMQRIVPAALSLVGGGI